jgi:hypothetical protein
VAGCCCCSVDAVAPGSPAGYGTGGGPSGCTAPGVGGGGAREGTVGGSSLGGPNAGGDATVVGRDFATCDGAGGACRGGGSGFADAAPTAVNSLATPPPPGATAALPTGALAIGGGPRQPGGLQVGAAMMSLWQAGCTNPAVNKSSWREVVGRQWSAHSGLTAAAAAATDGTTHTRI